MTDAPALPSGLTTRPLTAADSRAVFELMAACEQHDVGSVEIEEADILSDWQRPSHDVTTSSVAVLDGDRMAGYAELVGPTRFDAAVLPSYRGRGIGTWLAAWARDLGRARGERELGMAVPEGSDGDRLLAALGYRVRWTSWVLRLGPGEQVAERPLPPGYRLRTATEDDHEQVYTVLEDAFLEWSDRPRASIGDVAAGVWGRPGFEPWHLQVVTTGGGDGGDGGGGTGERVVGVAVAWNTGEGGEVDTYVDRLAVAGDHRNRGLAQALLVAAFAAGRERGAVTSSLATDSRTGALSLYEKVGMKPMSTWLNRAVTLD
ncbi:GNAT family N-acetyltransferase [Nocardioides sp. YIM 152588]|uniref:GNAT family N-acetyltransferase n=1 Tax=Nocardioides sp. YIM 152588 TaxID=3158259 RepID=UPI0032E4E97A